MNGAVHRWNLFDFPNERRKHVLKAFHPVHRQQRLFDRFTVRVGRGRAASGNKGAHVRFALIGQQRNQACRFADRNGQNACGLRVERS